MTAEKHGSRISSESIKNELTALTMALTKAAQESTAKAHFITGESNYGEKRYKIEITFEEITHGA